MTDALSRLAAQAPSRQAPDARHDRADLLARILCTAPANERSRSRPGTRRVRLAVSGMAPVAIIAAVVVLVATGRDGAQAAYAVQPRPDGTVTIVIHRLSDPEGLQHELQAAGVPAVVDYDPRHAAYTCPGDAAAGSGATAQPATGSPSSGEDPSPAGDPAIGKETAGAFTVRPAKLGAGEKVVITSAEGTVGSIGFAVTDDPSRICGIPAPPSAPPAGG